nr:hypothetical protein [Psychrobacter sp. PraFG1]UNK04531.1 hypothetical protein MN210_09595 [Psychrobacter sp. PraFG1]
MVSPTALFTMLEMASHHLSTCKCVNDEHKDGCYSCILAYRNSHHRQDISRQSAVKLLTQILFNKDKLVPIEALNEVPTNHILESVLEERFVQALSKRFKVIKERVNNKPGYLIDTGSSMWVLEPQVEFGSEEGVLQTRADFVLRPHKQADRNKDNELIVYTDGYEYHKDIVTDDVLKRQSLLRSGRKVWVLTWDDLDPENTAKASSMPKLLLDSAKPSSPGYKLWDNFAPTHQWRSLQEIRGLLEQGSFEWLSAWLTDTEQTRQELIQCALCIAILQLSARPQLDQFITSQVTANNNWYEAVVSAMPNQSQDWRLVSDISGQPSAWYLLSYTEVANRKTLTTTSPMVSLFINIQDSVFSGQRIEDAKDKWREIWQAYNLLQYAPSFYAATQTGLQAGSFAHLLIQDDEVTRQADEALAIDNEWIDVRELSELTDEEIKHLQALISEVPDVGIDLTDNSGATIGTAELAWPNHKIALFIESIDQLPQLTDWLFISLDTDNWLEQFKLALDKE